MDSSLQKLIRAARGPVLLVTLGILLAIHQFSGISFDQTFPVLIIVFGLMWMLERMVPRPAVTANVPQTVTLPPMDYDPLRDVHQKVYGGDIPPKPVTVEQKDIPTAEIPVPRPVPPPQ